MTAPSILLAFTLSAMACVHADELDQHWKRAERAEANWRSADAELNVDLPSLDPCADATRERILQVKARSAMAMDASLAYYQAWRDLRLSILRRRQNQTTSSDVELRQINSSLEMTRRELAALRKRAESLQQVSTGGEASSDNLLRLIRAAEDAERYWLEVLREYEKEAPDRSLQIAKTQELIASVDKTITRLRQVRQYYELFYMGRFDRSRKNCTSSSR